MTFEYGRLIRDLAQDPPLLLPKQASIAIRPLFASLLVLFAVFAAGPLKTAAAAAGDVARPLRLDHDARRRRPGPPLARSAARLRSWPTAT